MKTMGHTLSWVALISVPLVLGSCDFSEYCLNCDALEDATNVDAPPDATEIDACPGTDEVCDGIDNDCDGEIDEGELPTIGDNCGTDIGECTFGTNACEDGQIICQGAVVPMQEICDMLDNDCDGMTDNNTSEEGQICGMDDGECLSGISECQGGSVVCVGVVDPVQETCDGLDNDCDGVLDEGLGAGAACGPMQGDTGECMLGQEMCVGGNIQCVGAVFATTEQCDDVDHDCDGNPTNGFDLANDIFNCNACGHACTDDFNVMEPHVLAVTCSTGACAIGTCETGYWDLDGVYENGCEYACDKQGDDEVCNLVDDNCNGVVDEGIMPPPNFCSPIGACSDPNVLVPICTMDGWKCDYENERPDVEVDGNGDIVPETFCDDKDNDCDGAIDEGDPLKGQACNDEMLGICQSTGIFECAADPAAPMECNFDTLGLPAAIEVCNNLDDDCDGATDENPTMGDINEWVTLGNGVEIFKYEASRPDATDTASGNTNTAIPCSKAGVIPWTNVKYPDAMSACERLGARLCTEADWALACEGPSILGPIVQDPMGDNLVVIEAEYFDVNTPGPMHTWVYSQAHQDYSRTGFMNAAPDLDTNNDETEALILSPRLDYVVEFAVPGVYYVWMRGRSTQGDGGGNRVHVGINGAIPTEGIEVGNFTTLNRWRWQNENNAGDTVILNIPSAGQHTISVWMNKDDMDFDKMVLTTNPAFVAEDFGPASPQGCTWAYGSSCDTHDPINNLTCNSNEYDTDPMTAGDQDGPVPAGDLAACYSDWGAAGQVFDLSGNVKEWAQARTAGQNPIRGGSYNNESGGMTCQFDFTAADDSFAFPNVGFRCCR